VTPATADTDAAIRRARDALNAAMPLVDVRLHLTLVSIFHFWARDWKDYVPAAAFDDLAAQLEAIKKGAPR
jgi:hypothetical protein